jgi:hypothetical protein
VDGKALPLSHFYHNDLTTTQDVISNDITTVCQPMIGVHQGTAPIMDGNNIDGEIY